MRERQCSLTFPYPYQEGYVSVATKTAYVSREHKSTADIRVHQKLLKHRLLPKQEERELIIKYQSGDRKALDVLIAHNMRFVYMVVNKYVHTDSDIFWDLFNEGCFGLFEAASRFDTSTDYKFISYAVWWVRQRINKYLNQHGNLVRPKQSDLDKIKQDIIDSLPEEDGLRKRLVNDKRSDFKLAGMVQYLSLDQEDPETGSTLAERLAAPEQDTNIDQNKHMLKCLSTRMPPREWDILSNLYGINGTEANLADLGRKYGCSRERVRQLKDQALNRAAKTVLKLGYKASDMDVAV